MEIQIKGVFNVIPLLVRYSQDGETYEVMVYFNIEENRLIHNLELPEEIATAFEKKVIEIYDPSLPSPENLPRFDDYVTPDLQEKINLAREGNISELEGITDLHKFIPDEEKEE